MTIILVDKADRNRDLQLANRVWDCIVSNLESERVFDAKTSELLRIGSVGQLGAQQAQKLAFVVQEQYLPHLSDNEVLFFDGRIGEVTLTGKGFGMDTPYHLLRHVTKETLERLYNFVRGSCGFDVL